MLGGRTPPTTASAISQAVWRVIILSAIIRINGCDDPIRGYERHRFQENFGRYLREKRIQTDTPLQMPMAWALLGILKPLQAMTL